MAGKDYYQILGVSRNATDKEIRQAYRKLARKYHPDLNAGDKTAEARFKEVQEAYDVLSDPEKRAQYDRFGEGWPYGETSRPGGFEWTFTDVGPQFDGFRFDFGRPGGATGDLGSIFERLFETVGHGRAAQDTMRRTQRGQDIEHHIEVTLEEAYQGTQRLIEVNVPGSSRPRRVEVKIPPGVQDGSRIRVAGEGYEGLAGGPRGDLYLIVSVKPHPLFERKGNDLYSEVPIPLSQAILGGEVQVPTLKGKVALKIPAETQNGRTFRLAGLGMPRLQGTGKGDLYVKVKVVLPTGLTPKERALFEELQRLRPVA
ncbi:MAG: DnaJ domain-containing protein [Chloroflexi bacterium]|nr:DnaJ domain-containing protein [Chloroflexota bacterium]MCL5074716.1 DnaJ domain-containing protein [Chloroflexota bacterium]